LESKWTGHHESLPIKSVVLQDLTLDIQHRSWILDEPAEDL
jgi:hypothetical protein